MRGLPALLAAPLLVAALAAPAPAQIGQQLPEVELEKFANTSAKDFEDFRGRTVLIEFFAYW